MTAAEIYIRTQRTPLVCAAVLLGGVLVPSVVLIWVTPSDLSAYADIFTGTFEVLSILLAIVFGGWLLGTEYRQGTVKRLLTSEPRRLRAIATKGLVGAGALSAVLVATAGIGWAAAHIVGSMNDVTVPWDGRTLLAAGVTALIGATVAYSLSAVTRSDSFAMVGTVTMLLVLTPLLSLIPKVGKYMIGSALEGLSQWMAGDASEALATSSPGTAAITLAAWLTVLLAGGAVLFASRDV